MLSTCLAGADCSTAPLKKVATSRRVLGYGSMAMFYVYIYIYIYTHTPVPYVCVYIYIYIYT